MREDIREILETTAPELSKQQKENIINAVTKYICKAISMAEWEASNGAYSQMMFSMKHGR